MTSFTTRRHPFKFYATVVFCFVFLCGMGIVSLVTGIDRLQQEHPRGKDYALPVLAVGVFVLAVSLPYTYWKNAPTVTIDAHTIQIGDQFFALADIEDVALTGKMPFRFIIGFPMEGTAILFKDETVKVLFDDMYANSAELKSFIDQVVVKKQEFTYTLIPEIHANELAGEAEESFKGNPLFTWQGIVFWVVMGMFAFVVIGSRFDLPVGALAFIGAASTYYAVFFTKILYYFGLTDSYLIVRNHHLFWFVRIYRFTDVKEVVFESLGNQPNCLRVITHDFQSKLYPAATLSDQTWLRLQDNLEAKGVVVRNECIYRD